MEKHCKVIFLENINGIIKIKNKNGNLFITSDEEIKEGDWCFNSHDNQIWKYKPSPCPLPYWGNKDTLTKIIATTDISLISINEQYFNINKSRKSAILEQKTLPQIPQQFIEKWIEEYNKGSLITEVMVEYKTEEYCLPMPNIHIKQYREILKINFDNTINIKPIKNTWNREEVVKLLHKSHCLKSISFIQNNSLDKWLEENL